VELFDRLFVRFTPEYLATDVSPLVAFSIAITVANSLKTNTARRLEWMAAAFAAVDLRVCPSINRDSLGRMITNGSVQDPEIADLSEHAPALLNSVVQKLETLHDEISRDRPYDQILQTIARVNGKAQTMRAALSSHGFNRTG
jgi:hypothetical protein